MVENLRFPPKRPAEGHLQKSVGTPAFAVNQDVHPRLLKSPLKSAPLPTAVSKPRQAARTAGQKWLGGASVATPALYPVLSSNGFRHSENLPAKFVFRQKRSREYRQKLPYTTLFPTASSSRSSTSRTNGPRSLSRAKVGTHSAFAEGSHTAAYTPKHGAFRMGALSLPSERSARSRTSPGRVSERQTLPLLGLGRGCSRRTQRACGTAMRLCASLFRRRRGPAGLRRPTPPAERTVLAPISPRVQLCLRRPAFPLSAFIPGA